MGSESNIAQVRVQRRLEIHIITNNSVLLEALREDNEVSVASRYNANSVIFSSRLPFSGYRELKPYHRIFLLSEFLHTPCIFAFTGLKDTLEEIGGKAFLHSWVKNDYEDFGELLTDAKQKLTAELKIVYAELDSK